MSGSSGHTIVIGAGIGGLSAAMRLAAQNLPVTVLERHAHIGGKMRTMESMAGPVDAGPTVLTLRPVFENLLAECDERLSDHVTLHPAEVLARHWWSDGTQLDLANDSARNHAAIERVFGPQDARAFDRFCSRAQRLFEALDVPMIQEATPRQRKLAARVMREPSLLTAMDPMRNLAASLSHQFRSPHLQQLFGRYATYVGGSPYEAPALLSLIWHAEASGVWAIEGGMHRLAQAMGAVIEAKGGVISTEIGVARIETQDGTVRGVVTDEGTRIACDQVVFNGDPRALHEGLLGKRFVETVKADAVSPRSLSAYVWSFAATVSGQPLSHHNVFFADDPSVEFNDLKAGRIPRDATLYVCAQDRANGATPTGMERFEIIMNGPPSMATHPLSEEKCKCREYTFNRLKRMGLSMDPIPDLEALTTPAEFNAMFPASAGSLYGRSPHGLMAGLKRPTATTHIPGLYLAGGGTHPGAGIPMAALSGKHAAEAIRRDLTSTSGSPQTATPGGMSMGSVTTAIGPSRSSAS